MRKPTSKVKAKVTVRREEIEQELQEVCNKNLIYLERAKELAWSEIDKNPHTQSLPSFDQNLYAEFFVAGSVELLRMQYREVYIQSYTITEIEEMFKRFAEYVTSRATPTKHLPLESRAGYNEFFVSGAKAALAMLNEVITLREGSSTIVYRVKAEKITQPLTK